MSEHNHDPEKLDTILSDPLLNVLDKMMLVHQITLDIYSNLKERLSDNEKIIDNLENRIVKVEKLLKEKEN